MKLLIALSLVSYCLAMPTPNNATENLVRMMEKMRDRLFSAQCVIENPGNNPEMTLYAEPMECMWPRMHNLSHTIDQWVTLMGNTGCTVPQENVVNMMRRAMEQRHYEDSPIIRKFPTAQCGMCGRRIQCCAADHFLVQSYRSTACESAPCQVEPMTVENWNYLREKYPEWNLPTTNEPCNFASIMRESMMQSRIFPFMRRMYMQVLGSEIPTMNCHMVDNMCACCCNGFVWQNGHCVPETGMEGQNTMTPVVETSTMDMTSSERPVRVSTTPKTLFNEDEVTTAAPTTEAPATEAPSTEAPTTEAPTTEAPTTEAPTTEATDDDEEEEESRKRRSAEEGESSEEEEAENLAAEAREIVAEETQAAVEVVEEVIAEETATELESTSTESATTPAVEATTAEAVTEGTTIPPVEVTTAVPSESTTIQPVEPISTTVRPTEQWTEGTTVAAVTLETTIRPVNATNATVTLETTTAPVPTPLVENVADPQQQPAQNQQ